MIVAGTSGEVYPVAGLPAVANEAGAKVIDVNPAMSPISRMSDCYLAGASGDLLPLIVQNLS